MAAAAAAFQTYLENHFTVDLATEIIGHGFDGVDTFAVSTKSEMEALAQTIRETVEDDTVVPVVYFTVTMVQQRRLWHIAMYCRFLNMCNITHTAARGTVANLNRIARYFESLGKAKDVYKDIKDYPDAYDGKDSFAALEDLVNHLSTSRGRNGTLLTYITRKYANPDHNPDPDPGWLQPSVEDFAVRHASHNDDDYVSNNKEVWTAVHKLVHKTTAWRVVSRYKNAQDGRSAVNALNDHFLGEGHVDMRRQRAVEIIETSWWDGKKNFAFDTFTAKVIGAFDTLDECGDPRSEVAKVEALLGMIKESSQLGPACTVVRGDARYNSDLRAAINYLTKEAQSKKILRAKSQNRRQLAAMGSGRGNGNNGGRGNGGGFNGGRYGGRGRGGRGRGGSGRGGGRSVVYSEDGQHILNDGRYPPDVWRNFTPRDQAYVLQSRARSRGRREREISDVNSRERDANQNGGDDANSNGNGNAGGDTGSHILRTPGRRRN